MISVRDESASRTGRRAGRALEALGCASEAIGPIDPGLRLFLLTRGQFSMFDMIAHVVREIGPSAVSVWTWAISEYETAAMGGIMVRREITAARLVIDRAAENNGRAETLEAWRARFGADAVRLCHNHAKIARVWNNERRVLIRGSMNLNCNPRFEQADITEGGPEFDLVASVEDGLPVLPSDVPRGDVDLATGVGRRYEVATLAMFAGLKVWAK